MLNTSCAIHFIHHVTRRRKFLQFQADVERSRLHQYGHIAPSPSIQTHLRVGKNIRFKSEFIISWPEASSTVNQFQQISTCNDPSAEKQLETGPALGKIVQFSYHLSRFSFQSTICGFF
ncbi:hypothetical protein SADUNF_Sadunf13G0089800 [Salix dunnii]|uniref:Uncharacterized protein n=1 Tax=Salix dunnii TaxID=1413687 RepID=A0A835MNK5_9ROSI|nr:hypothetical protein SADUNF_Sadunf13G0089800 [Salix dunnii]